MANVPSTNVGETTLPIGVILTIASGLFALFLAIVSFVIKWYFDQLGKRMEKIEDKIDDVKADIGSLTTTTATIEGRVPKDLTERLARIEERLGDGLKESLRELDQKIPADLQNTIKSLEQRIPPDLAETLRRINEQLGKSQESGKSGKASAAGD
jgi:F0F1-type ATP synthase membrane subunit b/b'